MMKFIAALRESVVGTFRRFGGLSSLAAIGGIADIPSGPRNVEDDPQRHFTAVN
jgi:hypothetical protein